MLKQIGEYWTKDSDSVYVMGNKIKGADYETFEVINRVWCRDKNYIYDIEGIAKRVACPGLFKALDNGYSVCPRSGIGTEFSVGIDGSAVYIKNYYGKTKVHKGVDAGSVERLEYQFYRDDKAVYHDGARLPKCDPDNFVVLDSVYSTDGRYVYFCSSLLRGLRPDKLQILGIQAITDENLIYYYRDLVDSIPDNEDLEL